ncbi:MAG TPA: bifunctional (p)ppGpp synthetase/guanosine-3',5'-bis(diphosphate) 3'-pyrophosphohydrolase, partial [Calditrichaeota bacterium]|nr:bifunctional (p)ppGpp synthetase/guanosine-3',5'-bis(diphosphate) 3'-pyrophosphohydrolase [Calditrichota bacterium]
MIKVSEKTLLKRNHKVVDPIFEKLLKQLNGYCTAKDEELIKKAYDFGMKAHLHQRRESGKPYFTHCLEVARILADLRMDLPTILAGLLHDVVEDTGISVDELKEEFGESVALLVDGVTKISGLKFQSKEARQAETFRKMLLSMAMDIRVIIIKFADRLHNMRTLYHIKKEEKRKRIAKETLDVYVPLAHRLGIASIKGDLEDLALKYLEPAVYKDIAKKIELTGEERNAYIQMITKPIDKELKKNKIKAQISGRPKTFYSIYNKMVRRNRPFDEIYDIMAIRIIVDKIEECYYALGIVHSKYMPVYDRFKDYIA